MLRTALRREVGRRADDDDAQLTQPTGPNARIWQVANPHGQVEPLREQIDRLVGRPELHLDPRVALHELASRRHHMCSGECRWGTDPQ